MADVEPTDNEIQAEMEWRGEEEAERRANEAARPVEDREPVGPYAPTRTDPHIEVNVPMPGAGRSLSFQSLAEAAQRIRIGDVGRLVEAGMTATAAAEHVERMAKIRATRDSEHESAFRQGRDAGFAEHARVVKAEREAATLGGVLDTTETWSESTPSAYDVAERALDYASRLVSPVYAVNTMVDEQIGPVAVQYARMTTDLADRLYGWLWQFTDMDGPRSEIETCGSCSQPRERHDPGCLYAPRERAGDPWEPLTGVLKSDTPIRFEPAEQVDDGPAPTPEQQACPECRQGKHDNCPGRVLENDEGDGGAPVYAACPCALDTHPESIGGGQ